MARPGRKPKQQPPAGNGAAAAPAAGPKAAEGETVSGYLRRVFKEYPRLLGTRSNDEILGRWLQDHPGHKEVPERVRQILSNVKSVLRTKRRKKRSGGKAPAAEASPARPKPASHRLEALEEKIDGCLADARALDEQGLAAAVGHLRRARNEVVWKLGE